MPRLTIDGRTIEAAAGQSVLEAAREAGIVVPTLCYHRDLSPAGSCRLCLVEVEGAKVPLAACTLPAAEGMVVRTQTPELVESRRVILEMLARNYLPGPAYFGKENEFEHWARHYGVAIGRFVVPPSGGKRPSESMIASPPEGGTTNEPISRTPRYPIDADPNPFIRVDMNQCILCTRCVRACQEVQGRFVWSVAQRGSEARIVAGLDTTMLDARCESCGACSAYCPTGALVDRVTVAPPADGSVGVPAEAGTPTNRTVATTCSYCGVGCQFQLHVRQQRIVAVTPLPEAPVNGMSLCVKGRYGWDYVHHPDRLTRPRVRQYLLDGLDAANRPADRGPWVEVDWATALDVAARRLVDIKQTSGGDRIGVMASAKCTNEENYLMQKFARQVLGVNHIDHCARLCHSSTVAGLAMALSSGAMSNSMRDVAEHARAMLIIGSNTTEQHPVFGTMIRQAVLRRGLQLVVADPRRIDITEFAALHLRQRPGTDIALINGLMHIVLREGWHDRAFIEARCEGFAEFRDTLAAYPPARVAQITGVAELDLERAARMLACNRPMAAIWAMGITQHTTGVMNVLALANLQMLLGNLGVPGGGVNPLRGQNNVQGACDMGALPNVFPGYQSVASAEARDKFAAAWRCTAGDIAGGSPGLTVTEMVSAAGTGRLRGLYILGEDPVMTEPDVNHVRRALAASELIVLQEIFPSETAEYADVLLPGASFAEKWGTYTNTERRVQLVRQAISPPGEARADWQITAELARRMLALEGRQPAGPHAAWDYADPAAILAEAAALTPSYAGVSHARLLRGDTLQWPVLNDQHPGTPILHVERFTRGLGKFHPVEHLDPHELPDAEYPMILTTGRVLYHWHGGELTRRAQGLLAAFPESLIELHRDDAVRLGIDDGALVRVQSRRGEVTARAVITERTAPGLVFGTFHFPAEQNINNLTLCELDPIAKIPEYKVCAVRVAPA